MAKVSIVVPIYNVEQYLEKCIKSIVDQTYSNLEIILVDDGSKDSSPEICDKWKEQDQRIVVIHKENGGLSSARNAGLEVATGDYIMFEDSDDWLELDIVKKSVERIEKDASDLVIFGYTKVDEGGNNLGKFTFGNDTYTREEMYGQLHSGILEMSFGYAWNKLYRLSKIKQNGIINDGNIIDREDLVFNLQLLKCLNRISFLERTGYYYLQRTTSLLHNFDFARLKGIGYFCENMRRALETFPNSRKLYNMIVLYYLSDVIIKNIIWNDGVKKSGKTNEIKNVITEVPYKELLFNDKENPRHLNILYRGIKTNKYRLFYGYVRVSDFLNKIKG